VEKVNDKEKIAAFAYNSLNGAVNANKSRGYFTNWLMKSQFP